MPLEGLLMAAFVYSVAILLSVLAPTATFLVIALVSLRGTKPAERTAILRSLAALRQDRDQRRLPSSSSPTPSRRRGIRTCRHGHSHLATDSADAPLPPMPPRSEWPCN